LISTAGRNYTLPDLNGVIALTTGVQTFSDKLFDTTNVFVSGTNSIGFTPNGLGNARINLRMNSGQIAGIFNANIPAMTGTDEILMSLASQNVANKALDTTSTTIKGLGLGSIRFAVNGTSDLTIASNQTANRIATVPALTGGDTFAMLAQQQTITNKLLTTNIHIADGTDTSKRITFLLSGQTSNTTLTISSTQTTTGRVATIPALAASDTFLFAAQSATLTNKTITDNSNNVSANSLKTTTAPVNVASAAAPVTGQALVATSATTATWSNISRRLGVVTSPLLTFTGGVDTTASISTVLAIGAEILVTVSFNISTNTAANVGFNLRRTLPSLQNYKLDELLTPVIGNDYAVTRIYSFTATSAGTYTYAVRFLYSPASTLTVENLYFAINTV
jgi:hypothetical protein